MTQNRHQLKAEVREIKGRKVKHLRKAGITPAGVYGHGFESMSISINTAELNKIFDEVGESGLVDLTVDGKTIPILFRNPAYHPMGGMIHIDCYKVNLKEKIVATVPIELVGESPIVHLGNVLVDVTHEIEVEALPTDLPEKIEIDISGMDTLESVITVGDIKVADNVEIKTDLTQVIVKVEEPKVEEEPVAEEVAPGDVPATEQKAGEEGSTAGSEAKGEDKKEEKKD